VRISETKLCQLIEGRGLVIVDELSGDEILLSRSEVAGLNQAIAYFGPHL
jgi:hypothetical protein